jgi:hemerythrin-like domain-containing protein
MKPIGPLMREHRLIERLIRRLEQESGRLKKGDPVRPGFVEAAVDFFRTYADRTHHGKEEDILFKALAQKKLSPELKKIMDELVVEHILARKLVGQLSDAGKAYQPGNARSLNDVQKLLGELTNLYPGHIEKEDKHFFYPVMEYFTREEQDAMLRDFWEFDRNMIHEKYTKVVEGLES